MAKVAKIILHCSDSPDTHTHVDVDEIREWHTKQRGWKDIGYHFVVTRDGVIQVGRKENGDLVLQGGEIGAHTQGHNSDSIGVCWVGRTRMSVEQEKAVVYWLANLVRHYGLTVDDVYGHYEFNEHKTCPNVPMPFIRAKVKAELARQVKK